MKRIAVLGASGYTGAELVRLLATHPGMRVTALTADRRAGEAMAAVFPHLRHLDLPKLSWIEDVDWAAVDLAFCALPHGTTHEVVAAIPESVKVVDLSAGFRLRDPAVYEEWYGPHAAPQLQEAAVYGLTEFYREDVRAARLVAGTGCNAACGLYPLLPPLAAGAIRAEDIVIDIVTGVSGAGRSPKESSLYSEVAEGLNAYNVARHRHSAEFDQELSRAAGRKVRASFTPHLGPYNRGELATIYVKGEAAAIHETLRRRYAGEPFIRVLPLGEHPHTRHVRGSNFCDVGVVADRVPARAILFGALDNLVKGASGQAVQNANLMLGMPETQGLEAAPLFP
jgi:N-acetyl-gamma-glutamyl-phosphate reductase